MVQEVFDGNYLEDDGKVVLLCCRRCYSKYKKSIVKCAQPILSVCINSNRPRWSGDGDELKVISSSLELLLHWISDEKIIQDIWVKKILLKMTPHSVGMMGILNWYCVLKFVSTYRIEMEQ